MFSIDPWRLEPVVRHAQRILWSYRHWIGQDLVKPATALERARQLFEAPFAVLSHGLGPDPVLNYGNRLALELWEMDWDAFTNTPSRLTAEPGEREERDRLLKRVAAKGFCDDYRGIRISSSGRRFLIDGATVWNLLDEDGSPAGQAALFRQWRGLEPNSGEPGGRSRH